MDIDHNSVVAFAKSWGLFYLILLAAGVVIYALWPGNRQRFDRAKTSILDKDDRPGD
ncbi:nitrogen fixation protein FixQ [Shinella sp. SUS2]|jgi:cytochrome c oxidase cbb3-type subunit 4|uniref:CcoQ/FixQ family Cbb3-type cytochrome c oxidase assembly chaperone n=1 Tax=unclassified Shinella TaxID=2643062 RepID=UPI0003C530A6|nr:MULTISPECIES: CcoQ/FixQ family Cbb3-type cytochrome c oxidase assembly chaperone [unclassified Shinella]MCA0342256.1 CcoQ/FixQ family Cbb3-type cytochrome c oxidase assembly chaperone [Pseudomonadota bacterium]EYR81702.1 Cbb3-type cytochrome oxidase, subunit 3 [Shinella sp. DD12]KNY14296.1 nitrogen fixation protein FixQ [Shinella sp. SUS2]KOC71722.1 nitrogen fixation protein FixQ [Shinella sp. GWS1]MDG4675555.1 CcoQ/FixQ family Cbb3-type cytochrome c oxidase assembly chaperone [Shinella sp.